MNKLMRRTILTIALAGFIIPASTALAQGSSTDKFPTKPIRLLVGFAAGGSVDNAARIVAKKLGDVGWTVVVENRAGASGLIAVRELARSTPDGYTLMMGSVGNLALVPAAMKDPQVDVLRDLAPVAKIGSAPLIFVVNPTTSFTSMNDVIQQAKAEPGLLNYASGGTATPPHLAGELFASLAGISMNHIPYRGEAPALVDVIGNQVPMMFANLTAALPHVEAKSLRAIAVTSQARSPVVPMLPTVAESTGFTDFAVENWYGIVAPAGTPSAVVGRINQEVAKALSLPDVKTQFSAQGFTVDPISPEEFGHYMKSEYSKWAKVMKTVNIKLE